MKRHMFGVGAGIGSWFLMASFWAGTAGAAAVADSHGELTSPPGGSPPQVKDDLFPGTERFAANASDVTDVNLDRNMLGALSGKGKDASLAGQMNFIVVHSYTYDKPGLYRMEDVEAYQKRLTDGSWNCFIHTRERKSGEATDICSRNSGDSDTHELVIITAEPKELTFVHLSGRMSLSQLKMLGQMGGMSADMLMNMPTPPPPPVPPSPPVPRSPAQGKGQAKPQEQMLNDPQQRFREAREQTQTVAQNDMQETLRDAERRLDQVSKEIDQASGADMQQKLRDAETQVKYPTEGLK